MKRIAGLAAAALWAGLLVPLAACDESGTTPSRTPPTTPNPSAPPIPGPATR